MGNLMREAFSGTIIVESKPTTPEIEELRRLSKEAYDKAYEYQRRIDQAYLEFYKVPDIKGKWIRVHDDVKDSRYIGYVTNVERLFEAFRLTFSVMGNETHRNLTLRKENVEVTFDWTQSKNIEIITKEEALADIRNKFEEVLTSRHEND